MALNSDLRARVHSILSGTRDTSEFVHLRNLDLSDIRDEDDRKYVQSVIQTLFDLEPSNNERRLGMDFSQAVWLVWIEGYTGNIDANYYTAIRNLMHANMRGDALGSVYIPAKITPLKFVVEINPSPVEPPPRRGRSVARRSKTPARNKFRSRSPRRSVRRNRSPSSSPVPSRSVSPNPDHRYIPPDRDNSPARSISRSPPRPPSKTGISFLGFKIT